MKCHKLFKSNAYKSYWGIKTLKETPLKDEHIKLNATMVDFGGWLMPVQYSSIINEHNNTRENATLFDTCHMGEFLIEGDDALNFLQKVLTKDISNLLTGHCLYSLMCNEKGGIKDDLFVYKFSDKKYMLVVNASTIDKDLAHLKKYLFNVTIKDISNSTAKIDLQGPKSETILSEVMSSNLSSIKRFQFIKTEFNNKELIISRTGYTGEDGFELYIEPDEIVNLWQKIMHLKNKHDLLPAGLGARDTLRTECCYSLYGHEINEDINPVEAGLSFAISFDKKDFVGKNALIEAKANPKRKIVAFTLLENAIPRHGYKIYKGIKIGYVTSGTISPTLKKGIGIGLINVEHSTVGNEIEIEIRNAKKQAIIVKKPFYSYKKTKVEKDE